MDTREDKYGIAKLQNEMLDLLKEFIKLCDENHLQYFACGGTCLGAVRHNGFIPWDDDLDVFMPRPDYEKLWEACAGKVYEDGRFKLCRTTKEKNYHHRVMQLVDLNTTFINHRSMNEDIEHGVYIDIIPLDARAKGKFNQLKQAYNAMLYSVYNIQNLPEFNGGKAERTAVGFLLHLVKNPDKRYRIWSKAEKKMTQYSWEEADEIIELTTAMKNLRKPKPLWWFKTAVPHKFEDFNINLPAGYEEYLKDGFGDYMKYPPVEDQHPRHNTVYVDLDHPYTQFKGIYYLKQN